MKLAGFAASIAAFALASAAGACPLSDPMAAVDRYTLAYDLRPDNPAVGTPFQMAIVVCDPADAPYAGALRVDADMPAHRHGMNYKPTVAQTGPGAYLAEGFLLHMPGEWRFRFRLSGADGPVRLATEHVQP